MKTIICLMGPTASGKTDLAVELCQKYPLEIVSVDSAMVYRSMNIGTAKPSAEILKLAPHRLIDICDPKDPYSAGDFRRDAMQAIKEILAAGKIPLLVGGTMMYFRVLQQGIADLPGADSNIRAELTRRGNEEGWPALHAELVAIDPVAASKIHVNDCQRIQRALEVYLLTNKSISTLQAEGTSALAEYNVINFALMPERSILHEKVALRFKQMLSDGFIEEVQSLYVRSDLHADLPAIRSVGYREVWEYLSGQITKIEMEEKAISATRQLVKRQMTWLRSWPRSVHVVPRDLLDNVIRITDFESLVGVSA